MSVFVNSLDQEFAKRRCQFWIDNAKIDPETYCMTRYGNDGGYFHPRVLHKGVDAHRFIAFVLLLTQDQRENYDDLLVMHTCDTPPCFNPEHLFFGTDSDNIEDSINKGRWLSGENSPKTDLLQLDVDEIRRLASKGHRQAGIARTFNISQQEVSRIVTGKRWARTT